MTKRLRGLFLTTCRFAYGWYPKIPAVGRGSVEGLLSYFRWTMAKMVLYSPYTISCLAHRAGKSVRSIRLGLESSKASLRWLGLLAYATGNDVKVALDARTAWS